MANSYIDDIKVKISEKYKPPCKISMPMSYSQRLTLNKQLLDNRPSYDFELEKAVLKHIKEKKDFRKHLIEDRAERLELARKQFDDKVEREELDKLEQEEAKAKLLEESNVNTNIDTQTTNTYINTMSADQSQQNYFSQSSTNQNQQNYVSKNGILMPIPVSTHLDNTSNILKPVPMSNTNYEPQKPSIKPFNLSDFESDTSSPFDNMELKSINDLEELAQVLKSDRTSFQPNMYHNTGPFQDTSLYSNPTKSYNQLPINAKSYSNFSQDVMHSSRDYGQNSAHAQNPRSYNPNSVVSQGSIHYNQTPSSFSQVNSNYNPVSTSFSQYNMYNHQTTTTYDPPAVSNYSNVNGYYYNNIPNLPSHLPQGSTNTSYTPYISNAIQPSMQKSSCKSVPDLVKSIETELDNTHIGKTSKLSGNYIDRSKNAFHTTKNVPVPVRPKSTDAVYPKTKVKDDIFNPFDRLSSEQKEICRNVSGMGFPLDRVARVCLVYGSDKKKIVDHLLALTELLDLGFSEKDASEALAKADNDRDKALDFLIS